MVFGSGVPFAALLGLLMQNEGAAVYAIMALVAGFVGIFLERWLFLIEGQHVVNLYHGRQRT